MNVLRSQRGSATIEFAIIIPAIIMLLALCVLVVNAGIIKMKCAESAKTIARLSITSESSTSLDIQSLSDNIVGMATVVKTSVNDSIVSVQVSVNFSPLNIELSGEALGYL